MKAYDWNRLKRPWTTKKDKKRMQKTTKNKPSITLESKINMIGARSYKYSGVSNAAKRLPQAPMWAHNGLAGLVKYIFALLTFWKATKPPRKNKDNSSPILGANLSDLNLYDRFLCCKSSENKHAWMLC